MNTIIIIAMVTVIPLCALALKVAKKEDEQSANMKRRIKKLEMNNNTEEI